MNKISSNTPFTFKISKDRLGIEIYGERAAFEGLHEVLTGCWYREEEKKEDVCSYIGVLLFFSYEVRHAFMGNRIVSLDGKLIREWNEESYAMFEREPERYVVGVGLCWPRMLFVLSAWWECCRHIDISSDTLALMREFTSGVENVLQERSAREYRYIEPYIHGAIYSANPYLMHYMEYVTYDYLSWINYSSRMTVKHLARRMETGRYGSYQYEFLLNHLKKSAKKNECDIEDLSYDYSSMHVN